MITPLTEPETAISNPSVLEATPDVVPVKLISPTGGEETLEVPAAIAADDTLLRNLLAGHGVSMAANAAIERLEDGTIQLTKQAGTNG